MNISRQAQNVLAAEIYSRVPVNSLRFTRNGENDFTLCLSMSEAS